MASYDVKVDLKMQRYVKVLGTHYYYQRYTDLIIQCYHERAFHTGCAQTLSSIRQKYWIPQGRRTVNRVLRKCSICRRHEGGPYKMPHMPPIPTERVSTSAPFTYTGVDYFGPLFIKTKKETQKVWVCLYTCLATRAIHLELMYNMTTQQFLIMFLLVLTIRKVAYVIYCTCFRFKHII